MLGVEKSEKSKNPKFSDEDTYTKPESTKEEDKKLTDFLYNDSYLDSAYNTYEKHKRMLLPKYMKSIRSDLQLMFDEAESEGVKKNLLVDYMRTDTFSPLLKIFMKPATRKLRK